ncbi:MAG: GNAT family N-acetyltransferase [Phycisphaerae bacterium]|nr:GNAT family N-acetyltransferase [Phycisphaerae bacterium]HOO16384.1 GNAT family N-acetyltransferase [Phycisphaerae bacterium]HPC21001.1 GNAT family N-acetyltransferase [Phycisphaerae bacterium]HRS26804.1 GNAT family N-acetyltransferase [Phycisphaerae bacterium]HRT42160.1 GNAT family N-acetyltransferase [Phycisphaerae bacterium]
MPNVEQISPEELKRALPLLLATPGGRAASRAAVQVFQDYIRDPRIQWDAWRIGSVDRPAALVLALLLPGSTAIVLVPVPGELGIRASEQQELLQAALARLCQRGLYFAQALILPTAHAQKDLLESAGFRLLAPLTYLERDVRYPWVDPPQVEESVWLTFGRQTYDEFAALLLETYKESQDCPELTRLRPIDAVIAGHQAAGEFDPTLWEILRVDGVSAGCILLAALRDGRTVELAYMGVAPAFRRRGLATVLLRRALALCRARSARRLTLAVDERNEPAKRVYQRNGFQVTTQRDAYLFPFSSPGGLQAG